MDNKKQLYNIQKTLIIQMKLNPETSKYVSEAYAYAWSKSVYPYFDDMIELHSEYEKEFNISKEKISKL